MMRLAREETQHRRPWSASLLSVILVAVLQGSPPAQAVTSNHIAVLRLIRQGIAQQDVTYGLFLVDSQTGSATRIYKTDTFLFKGSWSPDATQLSFVQADIGALGACHVYVINADGSGAHTIRDTPFGTCPFYPSWSPDGSRILFQEGVNLFSMAPDGSDVVQLTTFDAPKAYLSGVAWSPDGSQIAFARDRRHGGGRLYTAAADGSEIALIHACSTPLCRAGYRTANPAWSPSGRRLAFDEARNVYTISVHGHGKRRVTDCPRTLRYQACSAAAPTWSPTGERLAYVSDGRLRVAKLTSGWVRTLGPRRLGGPVWEPS